MSKSTCKYCGSQALKSWHRGDQTVVKCRDCGRWRHLSIDDYISGTAHHFRGVTEKEVG